MRSSLTVAGIEVELVVPAGPLERIVADRYAGFLGTPGAAPCRLEIEPGSGLKTEHPVMPALVERVAATRFEVAHAAFTGFFELQGRGVIRCAVAPLATDEVLRTLFALLAPFHDGLLLRATGVIEGGLARVFAGAGTATIVDVPGPRLAPPGGCVMVRRVDDGWVASSTPFDKSTDDSGLPREARLARLSSLVDRDFAMDREQLARTIEDNVLLPTPDQETRRAAHDLTAALAGLTPCTPLPLDPLPGPDQRLVPVPDHAEVTWQ